MFKKFSIIAACMVMSAAAVFADGEEMHSKRNEMHSKEKKPYPYSGGFVTGFNLSTLDGAGVNVGYYDTCWLVDVSANYNHILKTNITSVVGHLGLRNRVYHSLFVDYGFMGLGRFIESHNGWGLGVFAGLSIDLSKHFLIAGKVYPYNYLHSRVNQVFANATISFLYKF